MKNSLITAPVVISQQTGFVEVKKFFFPLSSHPPKSYAAREFTLRLKVIQKAILILDM